MLGMPRPPSFSELDAVVELEVILPFIRRREQVP